MSNKLLLRKGSLENLVNLPKVAGAISITTDVPGIYLDKDSNTRIRIGDFIPVASLSALNNLAKEGLSEHALYYAQEENVLARYSNSAPHKDAQGNVTYGPGLVWINDTTALESRLNTTIDNLEDKVDEAFGFAYNKSKTIKSEFERVDTAIGTSTDSKDKNTVYGAIAKEADRADQAEKALGKRIDDLIGKEGTEGTIADIVKDIAELRNEDTAINNLLADLYGEEIPTDGPESTIRGIAGELSELKKDLGDFESDAQVNKLEEIVVKIDGDTTDYASAVAVSNGLKTITVTLPKDLEKYDSGNQLSTIRDGITSNTNLIKQVYGVDNDKNIPTTNYKTIVQNASDITTIKGTGWATGETIHQNASDITAIKGTGWTSTETIHQNATDITIIKGTGWATGETIHQNASDIKDINTAIDNITKTDGTIDTKIAALRGTSSDAATAITVYGAHKAVSDLKGNANTANTVLGNTKAIADLKGTESSGTGTVLGNKKAIADLTGTESSATGTVLGNKKAISELNTAINNIKAIPESTSTYESIYAGVEAAKSYSDIENQKLAESINATIASANAMTFRGTITTEDNRLPLSWWNSANKVQAGDTYVLGSNIINVDLDGNTENTDEPLRIGDLLVASHDQSGNSYPITIREAGHTAYTTTEPGWYLIRTGYDRNLENQLTLQTNTIKLESYAGTGLGTVTFAAPKIPNAAGPTSGTDNKAGSNIEITTDAASSQIQFNLVWIDF